MQFYKRGTILFCIL